MRRNLFITDVYVFCGLTFSWIWHVGETSGDSNSGSLHKIMSLSLLSRLGIFWCVIRENISMKLKFMVNTEE